MLLRVEFEGRTMDFETAPGLFSPAHADRGTLAMLRAARLEAGQRVLDLGCGWGWRACTRRLCAARKTWR